MKAICDRPALLEAVNGIAGVVPTRTPSPVLRCVKLTASEGGLMLAATDLEVGLRLAVDQVDVEDPGEALIPADKLTQIVRNSDDPTLTIETVDHTMHIRGADAHFTIYGYDPGEAPEVRAFDEEHVDCEIDGGTLQKMIHRTLFAAATENSRYAINGVLFERDGRNVRMVATDGRRLALARGRCFALAPVADAGAGDVEGGGTSGGDGSSTATCIVPSKALGLIGKLIRDPDAPVRVSIGENQALFSIGAAAGDTSGAAVVSTNLVEGSFPPFEDVIPKDLDKKVSFDVEILRSAIRRAALLTNEESKGVRMSFAESQLTLTSRAPEMGEAEIHVEMKEYEGDPVEIGFNPVFITDALKVIDGGDVLIELKAPNKPGVLKTGSEFTYVVMPVNLQ